MIKLGINADAPDAQEGTFQIYAKGDSIEIKDPKDNVINLSTLKSLVEKLQLYIFGEGTAYPNFSDLPDSDIPVGAYAVENKSGRLYRSVEYESKIAWIPQEAYGTGDGFTVDAHINGDETSLSGTGTVLETVGVESQDWNIIYIPGGGTSISITPKVEIPLSAVRIKTPSLSDLPKSYRVSTNFWVICELQVIVLNSLQPSSAIFPIVKEGNGNFTAIGAFGGSADINYFKLEGDDPSDYDSVSTNFWKYDKMFEAEESFLLEMRFIDDGQSQIDSFINGEPYASNSIAEFTDGTEEWKVGLIFEAKNPTGFTVVIKKFTLVTRQPDED